MAVTAAFRRTWLVEQAETASAQESSLRARLVAERNAAKSSVASGQVLSSSSRDGISVAFSDPGRAWPSFQDLYELAGSLIALFDAVKAALIAEGTASPTDDEILARMLATPAMQPYPRRMDFSRYGTTYAA